MKQNNFKIITPSYNNAEWVEYNIASLLNQTYTNWKVLYINDNSTDDTLARVLSIVGQNDKFTVVDNKSNLGAMCNYFENMHYIEDDDIVLHLDGDDWLIDENVLENLNALYNTKDCWMTYGGMVAWDGEGYTPTHPQNSLYSDFVHTHKLYRNDWWRASHLRTYRGFLLKSIRDEDLKDLTEHKYYNHASDLAFQYAYMEMCGQERIQAVDFHAYVYNQHPSVVNRTREREQSSNSKYEVEIRNRKKYKTGLSATKLPLINVIGDFRERNSMATTFSYVYNQLYGEFDITLIQDSDCIRYINGEFGKLPGIVVADVHEPPHLFNQSSIYSLVEANSDKFDYILTYGDKLLQLPNAIFRNGGYECVLNKNIHSLEHPLLADESLFKIYPKSKSISFITSAKQFTEYHRLRVEAAKFIQEHKLPVDIFGVGINPINMKLDGLKDYRFSIAMENGACDNYFTEKILDCFLTGTVPIYKGCPNISKFFNIGGIVNFDTVEELGVIIQRIEDGYYVIDPSILEENYQKALSYCYTNDRLFVKYFQPLL